MRILRQASPRTDYDTLKTTGECGIFLDVCVTVPHFSTTM